MTKLMWIGALAALLGGCMGATGEQLRKRAAFDLNCPEDQITLVELDKRTRGVRGCGRSGSYVEHCRACANGYPACDCTWILNSEAK